MVDDTPTLYRNACIIYEALAKEADEDGRWQGKLVAFCEQHGVPQSKYTYVMNALRRMGCIIRVRRGANTAPTVLELVQEPTLELYNMHDGSQYNVTPQKKQEEGYEPLQQQIRDLGKRVTTLEKALSDS